MREDEYMNNASPRLFTAKSLVCQAASLMFKNMVTVVRLSAGFIFTLVVCLATLLLIWVKYTSALPLVVAYWSPIVLTVTVIMIGVITLIRLYRFAALGSRVEKFLLAELFCKRTWRFIGVNILIVLQIIVLSLLVAIPVYLIVAALNGGLNNMAHGPLGAAVTEALQTVMYLPAAMLMAVRYTLSSPAASIQDRVSFEALSTAGAPYRKDLILVVLLLLGAPSALSAGQTFLEAAQIGPAWISSAWLQVVLVLYCLLSYLVFIGASSLAYKALREDVERETEVVLSRMAYPEASAAAAQDGAAASNPAGGPSPDTAKEAPAPVNPGTSEDKA